MKSAKFTILKHVATGDIGIIVDSNITEASYCKTHDNEGEIIGCKEAGCYCFGNPQSNFAQDCLRAIDKYCGTLNFDDFNLAGVNNVSKMSELFTEHENREIITKFISDWERAHEKHIQCSGVTYWNGFYWRTIIISHETKNLSDFGFEIVKGLQAERIIEEMPDFPTMEGSSVSIKTTNFNYLFSREPSPYYCEILAWNY